MAEVQFSLDARNDLLSIITWLIENRSPTVASGYEAKFIGAIQRLGEFPGSGAPRPALGSNIRIVIVAPYLVIYRGEANSEIVEIVRIIHGRRNITAQSLLA